MINKCVENMENPDLLKGYLSGIAQKITLGEQLSDAATAADVLAFVMDNHANSPEIIGLATAALVSLSEQQIGAKALASQKTLGEKLVTIAESYV